MFVLGYQAFGTSSEALELYITRGIISWGAPIVSLLEYGVILTQQARSGFGTFKLIVREQQHNNIFYRLIIGLVSVLVEGPPNAGKTAIASQLAKNSDFPFIKICSPDDMVGFSESAKVLQIRKVIKITDYYLHIHKLRSVVAYSFSMMPTAQS